MSPNLYIITNQCNITEVVLSLMFLPSRFYFPLKLIQTNRKEDSGIVLSIQIFVPCFYRYNYAKITFKIVDNNDTILTEIVFFNISLRFGEFN